MLFVKIFCWITLLLVIQVFEHTFQTYFECGNNDSEVGTDISVMNVDASGFGSTTKCRNGTAPSESRYIFKLQKSKYLLSHFGLTNIINVKV